MIEEDDSDQHEWDRVREEKKRDQKRAEYLARIGEPLPRIMQELYLNSSTRFEFFDAVYNKDGTIEFPFGGTCVQQHSRDMPDVWRVHISLPIHSSWLPLRGPHGYLMSREQAFQFAREMQP